MVSIVFAVLHLQKRNLKNDELLKGGSKTANVVKRKFNTTTWTDSLVLVVVFGVIFSWINTKDIKYEMQKKLKSI